MQRIVAIVSLHRAIIAGLEVTAVEGVPHKDPLTAGMLNELAHAI